MVESPRWLAAHRGMSEAERSLRALRPPYYKDTAQLEATLAEIAKSVSEQAEELSSTEEARLRPILTATVLMSCVPLSGVFVVVFFAGDILGSIFPSQRNLAAVLVPLMGVIGVSFASCGADRVGRRPLLLLSAVGMALSMVVLGLYFHCHVP